MKLVKYMIIIHLSCCLCQDSTRVQGKADGNNTGGVMLEEPKGDPYVHQNKFNWTLRLPGNRSGDVVAFWLNSTDLLVEQICQDLNFGRVYDVNKTRSPPNTTCFHDCSYKDLRLQNCSQSVRDECTVINAAVCGHQAVWLAEGPDRCAGRVEVWRDGRRGTVCDDGWDLRDADVVCAQLGCGYALSVTGQGGSFPPGRGPVLLDELNCSGHEDNLWACQASQEEPDCGHKEDAGVICSEMRAIRLTGGADHCSGKLEVHRNGRWGTVCDNCWNEHLASMVCSMLRCGTRPLNFTQFVPPLLHNQGTLWYYHCRPEHQSLWQCREIANRPHLCTDSKAAGVICEGSLGFLTATTDNTTPVMTSSPTATTRVILMEDFNSPVLLISFTVCLLLLVLLITNTVLCCHYRRRQAFLLEQTRTSPRPRHLNNYHETVDLVKVTASQQQSDDSRRHRNNTNPLLSPPGVDGLCQEGPEPTHTATGAFAAPGGGPQDAQQARVSAISVDSFETSSTSSGENYENVTNSGYINVTPDPGEGRSSAVSGSLDPLMFLHNNNQHHSAQTRNLSSSDEDSLYSPVSPD